MTGGVLQGHGRAVPQGHGRAVPPTEPVSSGTRSPLFRERPRPAYRGQQPPRTQGRKKFPAWHRAGPVIADVSGHPHPRLVYFQSYFTFKWDAPPRTQGRSRGVRAVLTQGGQCGQNEDPQARAPCHAGAKQAGGFRMRLLPAPWLCLHRQALGVQVLRQDTGDRSGLRLTI